MSKSSAKVRMLTQLALLSAILFLMGFTPLGSIPLGGPIVATLAAVPVMVGAILLGVKPGVFLGFVFGVVSLLWFTLYGPPTAFVFSPFYSVGMAGGSLIRSVWYGLGSIVICFVPRMLIGFVSGRLYLWLHQKSGSVSKAALLAGVCGSLTNTLLVLLGILVFFAAPYAAANGNQAIWVIIGTSILVNGIPEAIVTPLLTVAVVKPLTALRERRA